GHARRRRRRLEARAGRAPRDVAPRQGPVLVVLGPGDLRRRPAAHGPHVLGQEGGLEEGPPRAGDRSGPGRRALVAAARWWSYRTGREILFPPGAAGARLRGPNEYVGDSRVGCGRRTARS